MGKAPDFQARGLEFRELTGWCVSAIPGPGKAEAGGLLRLGGQPACHMANPCEPTRVRIQPTKTWNIFKNTHSEQMLVFLQMF